MPRSTVVASGARDERAAARGPGLRRVLAAIRGVTSTVVLFFPLATLRVLMGLDMTGEWRPDSTAWWIASWIEVVLSWLYGAWMVSGPARGTLGMQVMDLHVTRLHGERVSFGRATARYMAQFLTVFTLGVGVLMQVFTRRRQTLHDMVSGTVVVRTRGERAPAAAPAWSGR